MYHLTIFYDGTCPLCVKEMNALITQDKKQNIKVIDIYSEEFSAYPQIDANAANTVLHGLNANGELFLGWDKYFDALSLYFHCRPNPLD